MLRLIAMRRILHRRTGAAPLLVCTAMMAASCGGGSDDGGLRDRGAPAPGSPNPIELEFRSTALGDSVAPDGRNWRTQEYMGHWGLDAISAAEAYTRGHFGQGVTIAVADDGMDATHPDLAGRIVAQRHVVNGNATA